MARGIISTILGGVAGGLRGYASQQERRREEEAEERRREEERRRAEAQFAFQAAMSGGTPGARLRTDEAAVAAQRLRNTPLSRVLDQAPLFEQPSEAPVGRSALEAALQTRMPAPSFSAERRNIPQVTPITEDEDYFQLSSPEGQVYSFVTPEARERRRLAEEERVRGIAAEEGIASRDRVLSELMDRGVPYERALQVAWGVPMAERPEALQPTSSMREYEFLLNQGLSPEEARTAVGWETAEEPRPQPRPPASILEKIAANNSIIESANEALSLLDTEAAGGVGVRFGVPFGVGRAFERFGTPEERMLRAQVSNVGSQLLAARSGAAISAAEFERLSPFVPAITDNVETIRAKLNSLSRELSRVNRSYQDVMGAQTGGSPIDDILSDIYDQR